MSIETLAKLATMTIAALLAAGCASAPEPPPQPEPVAAVERPLPDYDAVAARINVRSERLERFFAGATTRVWYIGEQGEEETEQLDGYVHMVAPDKISLTLQKLGVDGAVLGSNEQRYWWFDLAEDPPVAAIGTHEKADPDRLGDFYLPVHPLDLILLFGFAPMPERDDEAAEMRWSPGGERLIVAAEARWGACEYWLDPESLEVQRVVLRRAADEPPVLTADLPIYQEFDDRVSGLPTKVRVPRRMLIDVPALDARARLTISAPRADRRRPDDRAFQLQDALARHGIKAFRDVDRELEQRSRSRPERGERAP
ncbi:MAG: hypothetical protein AAFX79_03985 [Planctomycetota bacterium]